jgi:hypothetical protein
MVRGRAAAPAALLGLALLALCVPRVAALDYLRPKLVYEARQRDELAQVVARAGGRDRLLGCGTAAVTGLMRPLAAWELRVPQDTIRIEAPERGVVLATRVTPAGSWEPALRAGYREVARTPAWRVAERCGG